MRPTWPIDVDTNMELVDSGDDAVLEWSAAGKRHYLTFTEAEAGVLHHALGELLEARAEERAHRLLHPKAQP